MLIFLVFVSGFFVSLSMNSCVDDDEVAKILRCCFRIDSSSPVSLFIAGAVDVSIKFRILEFL